MPTGMKMLAMVSMKPQIALPCCFVFTAAATTIESGVLSRKAQDRVSYTLFPHFTVTQTLARELKCLPKYNLVQSFLRCF